MLAFRWSLPILLVDAGLPFTSSQLLAELSFFLPSSPPTSLGHKPPRRDSVVLCAPPGTKTEWLARIDYIAAANQALVCCLVTWFYLPSQLWELGIPAIGRPKVLKGEVYLSDHREVIETSTVDCKSFSAHRFRRGKGEARNLNADLYPSVNS